VVVWYWLWKFKVLRGKPIAVSFYSPQIPHGQSWHLTYFPLITNQQLTSRGAARLRSTNFVNYVHFFGSYLTENTLCCPYKALTVKESNNSCVISLFRCTVSEVYWYLVTDVSGKRIVAIFKCQAVRTVCYITERIRFSGIPRGLHDTWRRDP
jgi:hypothetical protein